MTTDAELRFSMSQPREDEQLELNEAKQLRLRQVLGYCCALAKEGGGKLVWA